MAAKTKIVFNVFTGNFDLISVAGSGRRIGEDLSSQIDGATTSFSTSVKFVHDPPGDSIAAYYNGQRLLFGAGNDYTLAESGGSGTGFDTVNLLFTPKAAPGNPDVLLVDYTEL